jgi:DNA ligase-associated metallophosphoesterase
MSRQTVIEIAGEELWLLPEKALFWPARFTLIVADLHFGKAAAFRAGAIPVPAGTTAENLRRLDTALARTGARRLLCLGDLLHARAGRAVSTLAAISEWRAGHPTVEIGLVRGNHDRRSGDPPADWGVACSDEPLQEPPFVWRHTPLEDGAGYAIAGHLHPGVRLLGRGRQGITLPCFHFGRRLAVLPAFGSFTGLATIAPQPGDRLFAVADGEVIPLPA